MLHCSDTDLYSLCLLCVGVGLWVGACEVSRESGGDGGGRGGGEGECGSEQYAK